MSYKRRSTVKKVCCLTPSFAPMRCTAASDNWIAPCKKWSYSENTETAKQICTEVLFSQTVEASSPRTYRRGKYSKVKSWTVNKYIRCPGILSILTMTLIDIRVGVLAAYICYIQRISAEQEGVPVLVMGFSLHNKTKRGGRRRAPTWWVRSSLINFRESVHREFVFCWSAEAQETLPLRSPTACPINSSLLSLVIRSGRLESPCQMYANFPVLLTTCHEEKLWDVM